MLHEGLLTKKRKQAFHPYVGGLSLPVNEVKQLI